MEVINIIRQYRVYRISYSDFFKMLQSKQNLVLDFFRAITEVIGNLAIYIVR